MKSYPALATRTPLTGGVRLCGPVQDQPATTLDSPAILVMTDLTRVTAAVALPGMTVDDANLYMIGRGVRHSEVLVADVMTPANRLDAFDLQTVQGACVGNVVASLQRARRHHALVTQRNSGGGVEVCGIFSLSQIARQLGTPLQSPEGADTFAEIGAALARQ
jgi:hypothetical protein